MFNLYILSNCPCGQISLRANVFVGKCFSGQMSFWASVFRANVFLGKCLCGQMYNGQMSFWANILWAKSVIEWIDGWTDFAENEKPGGTFFLVYENANVQLGI
jgi:hypothetical protein